MSVNEPNSEAQAGRILDSVLVQLQVRFDQVADRKAQAHGLGQVRVLAGSLQGFDFDAKVQSRRAIAVASQAAGLRSAPLR